MSGDAVRRAIRTFVISFLGILIPGALQFMNDVTAWAAQKGQAPFPDWNEVSYLLVAAICAGMIALLNLIWNWVEDKTGKGFLRTPQPPDNR